MDGSYVIKEDNKITIHNAKDKKGFVINPDNTLVLDNQIATNKVTNHEVNFTPHNIGVYKVDMICVDGGRNGAETLYFEVTGDGFNNTIWFYILILALSAGIMIAGFKLTDPTITMFGTFGLYFLAIYILRFGIVGMKDVTTTWAIGLITLGVAMYVSARIGLEIINS